MPHDAPTIDVVILTREETQLPAAVVDSLRAQVGVHIQLHRVVGTPSTDDENRIATITRARNEAIEVTTSPWLMFLDDDVTLAPDCITRLHHALASRPEYAAFAADYLGEAARHGSSPHVSMGATLFRRRALRRVPFRWEPGKCECLCRCEDTRRSGSRIEYLPGAKAFHLAGENSADACNDHLPATDSAANPLATDDAKVLVAFNRRDVNRFRDVFLRMMRASGNEQEVIAVGYGLYPSESRLLAACRGVRVIHKVANGQMPPVRRLADFAEITASLDPQVPVAYWDASDVIIQAKLDPLWRLVQRHPKKIFGVREPLGYPHNVAIVGWTRTIQHPAMRRRAFELFSTRPFLNSGFSAGTAGSMHSYFKEAARLRDSSELKGTTDWGDQSAFNLYCHSDPERWKEIPESWNYCVHDRPVGEVQVMPDGRITCRSGTPIHIAHGNARSLAKLAIVH
ncbi:glycosyltransferase [Rubripirellula reticaptiva]|uniref:Glycosyltransferase 2-like domain-containing protein n=1 Tax=Rubripirellula reticaptiva TaxID=2528013 RepID=A0A5C6EKX4_9BACT|nr:glycosyltransferase [Rubripirellula reticaptiva]TWU49140.1 hypothetical protein Poly59_37540 [Rubripirellula reticaptiva]